jgi:Ser/Thr protein kinase RdoA (MazF antagonist)
MLEPWGDVRILGRLSGGYRSEVFEAVAADGRRLAARLSTRGEPALDWELDLLEHLRGLGFTVPAVVPSLDGRRHVRGVVVQEWLDGDPPAAGDWDAVAAELRRLHAVTRGRPQRPGFRSTRDLLRHRRGGDVDLSAMPEDAVRACRAAWRGLAGVPMAVVHGDPAPGNIRVTSGGIGLLDWDEARVDHVDLDLADLPAAVLPAQRQARARAAVHAWEAACGWLTENAYARTRLAALHSAAGESNAGRERRGRAGSRGSRR